MAQLSHDEKVGTNGQQEGEVGANAEDYFVAVALEKILDMDDCLVAQSVIYLKKYLLVHPFVRFYHAWAGETDDAGNPVYSTIGFAIFEKFYQRFGYPQIPEMMKQKVQPVSINENNEGVMGNQVRYNYVKDADGCATEAEIEFNIWKCSLDIKRGMRHQDSLIRWIYTHAETAMYGKGDISLVSNEMKEQYLALHPQHKQENINEEWRAEAASIQKEFGQSLEEEFGFAFRKNKNNNNKLQSNNTNKKKHKRGPPSKRGKKNKRKGKGKGKGQGQEMVIIDNSGDMKQVD